MALPKIEHPEQLPELAWQFPTMAALAEHLGVSRERVRQVLRRQGCTGFQYNSRRSKKYICPECGGHKARAAQTCMSCFSKSHRVLVACDYCGTLKEVQVSKLYYNTKRYKHWYCNHSCQAKAISLGILYGFAAHPENRVFKDGRHFHDYEAVWKKHLETGYGAIRLGRLLGIPVASVSTILRKMRENKSKEE